jgi:hypothetical protein
LSSKRCFFDCFSSAVKMWSLRIPKHFKCMYFNWEQFWFPWGKHLCDWARDQKLLIWEPRILIGDEVNIPSTRDVNHALKLDSASFYVGAEVNVHVTSERIKVLRLQSNEQNKNTRVSHLLASSISLKREKYSGGSRKFFEGQRLS